MKTIAVATQQIGRAKTTIAANIAATLAERGCRVLVVDADPQAGATYRFDIRHAGKGLYAVLCEGRNLPKIIRGTNIPGVHVAPSSAWLEGAERRLQSVSGAASLLRSKLSLVDAKYDYCLIDCAPQFGLLTENALAAAQSVLIPCATQEVSIEGLPKLYRSIASIRDKLNKALFVSGIIPYRVGRGTGDARALLDILRQQFPDDTLKTVIRENADLAEYVFTDEGTALRDIDWNTAVDYQALTKECLARWEDARSEDRAA